MGATTETKKRSLFGKKGTFIVFICFIYFYLGSAITSDGLNSLLPYFIENFQCSATQLNIWVTAGGWLTFIGNLGFGMWGHKSGAKKIILAGLAGNAVALLILANAANITMFGIAMILYIITTCGVSGIGMGMLGANWFPKKKGQFMGWATMGITVSGATAATTIQGLTAAIGMHGCMYAFTALIVVTFILTLAFVKDTPEEAGAYPDNDPTMSAGDVAELQRKTEEYKKTSKWTKGAILRSGFFWHMVIGWCLLGIGAFGLISQLSLAFMSFGHDIKWFLLMMTVCAPWGLFTSWAAGVIDEKKGTKFASICCGIMLVISQLSMVLFGHNLVAMCFGTALLCGTLSAQNNMAMSITTSKFGRFDFLNGWTMMSIFQKLCSLSGLVIVSAIADIAGNYRISIGVCAVITVISIIAMKTFDESCVGRNTLD